MRKVLFSAVFWLVLPAFSREKTDVLVMRNGDRITCEVKRLERGIIQVDLDYVDGTTSIDWQKVARLESKNMFVVQLQDGSIFAGRVVTPESLAGTPVKLEIQETTEAASVSVAQTDVVRMTQTSDNFVHRLNAGVTLGATYAKGNSTTQYNVASDIGYEEPVWGGRLRYASNLSSSTGAETATRNQADLTVYRSLRRKNYFYAGTASYLQSSVQGIQNQINIAFGIGAFLLNTNQVRLTLLGGPGWQRTNYVATATDQRLQDVAVFLINSSLDVFRFKKTRLTARANVIPAVTDAGRIFIKTDIAYYLKLFGKVDWNFSAYANWDSRPPMELSGSDYGSSIGLSYSFGNR